MRSRCCTHFYLILLKTMLISPSDCQTNFSYTLHRAVCSLYAINPILFFLLLFSRHSYQIPKSNGTNRIVQLKNPPPPFFFLAIFLPPAALDTASEINVNSRVRASQTIITCVPVVALVLAPAQCQMLSMCLLF